MRNETVDLVLTVTVSAGTSVERAASQAVALANRLGVGVEYAFNGWWFTVYPGVDPVDVVSMWKQCEQGKRPIFIKGASLTPRPG